MDARTRPSGHDWPLITHASAELLHPGDLLLAPVPAADLDAGGRLHGHVFEPVMNVRSIHPVRRSITGFLRAAPRQLRLRGTLGHAEVICDIPAQAQVAFVAG